MRIKLTVRFLCYGLFFILTIACAAPPHKVLNIQHWQINNGAKVFFVRSDQLPMLDVRVVFSAGSSYDGKNWGLAAFTKNILGEATTTMNADQIAVAFDQVGAVFSANVNRDMTSISLRSLTDSQYLQPALTTFIQVLTQAKFPQRAIDRVRGITLTAIADQEQNPSVIAKKAFYAALYKNRPYGHPVIGTADHIKQFTMADINAFYQRYYVAKNANIILVGNVSRDQANKISQRIATALPQGNPAPKLNLVPDLTAPNYVHVNYPAKQTTIIAGQVGINRQAPNYFPLLVGNYIFGGNPLASILFEQIRNKRGLAYSPYSRFIPLRYRGPFMATMQTRASKSKESLTVLNAQLQKFIQDGPTQSQLETSKNNLLNGFPLSLMSNARILNIVTSIAFYQRPLDFLDYYSQHVQAVTVQDIESAFTKLIKPNRLVTVTVGPNEQQAVTSHEPSR
ncbi:MAG: insulinase family protein [Gammaproteobacteria bacterium]|nr:insulinase family protein [Gammaproteobacteria bacterium]